MVSTYQELKDEPVKGKSFWQVMVGKSRQKYTCKKKPKSDAVILVHVCITFLSKLFKRTSRRK